MKVKGVYSTHFAAEKYTWDEKKHTFNLKVYKETDNHDVSEGFIVNE